MSTFFCPTCNKLVKGFSNHSCTALVDPAAIVNPAEDAEAVKAFASFLADRDTKITNYEEMLKLTAVGLRKIVALGKVKQSGIESAEIAGTLLTAIEELNKTLYKAGVVSVDKIMHVRV